MHVDVFEAAAQHIKLRLADERNCYRSFNVIHNLAVSSSSGSIKLTRELQPHLCELHLAKPLHQKHSGGLFDIAEPVGLRYQR